MIPHSIACMLPKFQSVSDFQEKPIATHERNLHLKPIATQGTFM